MGFNKPDGRAVRIGDVGKMAGSNAHVETIGAVHGERKAFLLTFFFKKSIPGISKQR